MAGAIVLGLAGAAPAQAAFGVTVDTASPVSTDAGAKSDFNLNLSFSGDESVRDLTVHLPPGLVGDPTSTPLCTEAQLNADTCPEASQIGVSDTTALPVGLPLPLEIPGEVFNVEPRTGEPARLGIVLTPPVGGKVILQSAAKLRPNDFGLDTILEDIPNDADGIPIRISEIGLSLDGAFMRNPTSCGIKTTSVDAVSHANTARSGSNSFNSVNCAALPFSPEFSAKIGAPGKTTPFTKPPQTTLIEQDEGEAGLLTANVLLPPLVGGDNEYLTNTCSPANFVAHTCPPASIVGQATAESPLQEEALTGPMALVQNPDGLPLLGLDLEGALALQLYGQLSLLPSSSGSETRVIFDDLPDIPIARFELELLADKLNLLGRDICVPPPLIYNTTFTSHGGVVQQGDTQGTVEGCVPSIVDPTATLKLKRATSDKPRLRAKVTEGSAGVDEVSVKAPKGVSFGDGKIVAKAGADKLPNSAVDVARKRITVTTDAAGVVRLGAKGGAVRVKDSVGGGDELPFVVDVTDADANDFSFDIVAIAR